MGIGSSSNLGKREGTWFNGKPIYSKDLAAVHKGISNGMYIKVSADNIPAGWELWFSLEENEAHAKYAKQSGMFHKWWVAHRQRVVGDVAKATGVDYAAVLTISNLALPALLDYNAEFAKKLVKQELAADSKVSSCADRVIDELSRHVGSHAGATEVMNTGLDKSKYVGLGEFYHHVDKSAYRRAAIKQGASEESDDFTGGCDCRRGGFIGAAEMDMTTVRDYSESINSKTKNQIIDELVQAGINLGMKITGDTPAEKIKSMISLLPAGDKIKTADDTHKKLCAAMARAINAAHGSEIIGKDMPPDVVCQQVVEIISSLSAGMHTEFLAVFNDVRKVLKNLHVLKGALEEDHAEMIQRINNSEDKLLPDQLATLSDLHKILLDEIERQIAMLSNLLNVTLFPVDKSLSELIRNKKDIHGYIDTINVKVGTERFSKVIADVLRGIGITASFALLIEKALKTVGMTMDEYAKGESVTKLREKITQKVMGQNIDEQKLHEYLQAAELLYQNFYRSQDIASTANKSGAAEEMEYNYEGSSEKHGGLALDERIKDRKNLRNLIFKAFYNQLQGAFDQMVNSIDSLTAKVGAEIPMSDQLSGFRQLLQRIDESLVRNKNIYYAIIGYYNDVLSKSKKDTLLADLNMVSNYIDTIVEMPIYASSKQYFSAVQNHIKAIISLIDKYSDEIAAKFGRFESEDSDAEARENKAHPDDNIADGKSGAYDFPDAVFGGAETFDKLEIEPTFLFKSTKSIHDSIRQFDYKYRVAQIRANMTATSKELHHYSEKYDKIVANSIADFLSKDKKTYDKLRLRLTDEKYIGKDLEFRVDNVEGFDTEANVKKQKEAALKMLDSQWETKKKFWATVEAVDTYMRVFTDALVKNPQDIKEIKSMIDSIEVINEWYTEKTGEELSGVFDHFPSHMQQGGGGAPHNNWISSHGVYSARAVVYPQKEYYTPDGHYYKRVADQAGKQPAALTPLANPADVLASARPGNPYLVTIPTFGEEARAQAKRAVGGMGVLKNLLSVFVHVGSKFGGEELRKKVFMTPTQMYNNLVEYLHNSAFAQGFGTGDFSAATEDSLPSGFYDASKITFELNMVTGNDNLVVPGPYGTSTTYVPGNLEIVHLGVLANHEHAGVASPDWHNNSFGIAIVEKINRAINNPAIPAGNPVVKRSVHQEWTNVLGPVESVVLFKKRWGVWMRSVLDGLKKHEGFSFQREDDYFVLVLKSLAAKILTVTGMYDVMDRPMEYNGLSPIRMITGGSYETPKVEDGAVALYLRLPLLAQFYRGIFGFDNPEDPINQFADVGGKTLKISLVPDVDGTFAGLIRLVFQKNKFNTGANYSDDDMKELVREVNLVYQRMLSKYPQNTVMETIHEFVAEVNRRYGVITQTERDSYNDEFGYRFDATSVSDSRLTPIDRYTEEPLIDVAILPGEDDEEITRMSGAQKLLGSTFDKSADKPKRHIVSKEYKDLVYKFRCAIDKYFENPQEEYTFNHAIKSTQMKLKHEKNDESRFKLVTTLLRGNDVYTKTDAMKYVLFHETVVGGLNLLSAVHSMLARFKKRAHLIDLEMMENLIWDFFEKTPAAVKTLNAARAYIVEHLTRNMGLVEDGDAQLVEQLDSLFGRHEAKQCNGGHIAHAGRDFVIKGADVGEATFVNRQFGATFRTHTAVVGMSAGFKDQTRGHIVFSNDVIANPPTMGNHEHMGSVLCGFSVQQLRAARKSKPDSEAKRAADVFIRYIFNREFIMKELLESLFGLSHDFQGLVDVKIEDKLLLVSFGGMKTLIEDMFQHVRYFMDLLRPQLSPELMNKYTDKSVPGSYYWLQEQLMEKIIIGRAPVPKPDAVKIKVPYVSIDEIMRKLSYTYQQLTQEWTIDKSGLLHGVNQCTAPLRPKNRDTFDKVFAELVFYDAAKPGCGLINSSETPVGAGASPADGSIGGLKLVDYMRGQYDQLHLHGPLGKKTLDTRFASRFYQLYSWKEELTFNRSAMFSFNQLIAKYIQNFYDATTNKMYGGLINQFANGSFNRSVSDFMYTYPDVAPLWLVKKSTNTDKSRIDINNIIFGIPYDEERHVPVMEIIVKQYLELGIDAADPGAAIRSAKLLNPRHADILGTSNVTAAGGAVPVPKIYKWFVLHTLGRLVHEILRLNSGRAAGDKILQVAAGAARAAALAIINALTLKTRTAAAGGGAPVALTRMGAIRTHFGIATAVGNVPTIGSIMGEILGMNDAERIAFINACCGNFNPATGEILEGGSPVSLMSGEAPYDNTIVASPSQFIVFIEIINEVLIPNTVWPMAAPGTDAILSAVLEIFPYTTNAIGATAAELNDRVNLFSNMAVSLYAYSLNLSAQVAALAIPTATANEYFRKRLKEIYLNVTDQKTLSVDSPISRNKTEIKYDELYDVIQDTWDGTPANRSKDSDNLVLARTEEVPNYLTANNINDVPGPNAPDAASPYVASIDLANIKKFGERWDPDADHVLYTSLANILRNLTTSMDKSTPVHVIDNVADIAMYMKERMRANLPAFRNLFKELVAKCEFLKKFIARPEMSLERSYAMTGRVVVGVFAPNLIPAHNPWPYVLKEPTTGSDDTKRRYNDVLDSIIRGCQSFIVSCDQTLREIGDDPKYMELYQNSIKDYKSQYNMEPFIPLSSTLAVLNNTDFAHQLDFFPVHSLGSDEFKFMYGTRSVLGNPTSQPNAEHLAGFMNTIDSFNIIVDQAMHVDKAKADLFIKSFVKLLRYVHEQKHVKGLLTPYVATQSSRVMDNQAVNYRLHTVDGLFTRDDLVLTDLNRRDGAQRTDIVRGGVKYFGIHGTGVGGAEHTHGPVILTNRADLSIVTDGKNKERETLHDYNIPYSKPVYAIIKTLTDTIKLTESSFKDDKIKELVEAVFSEKSENRNTLEIQNIVDLNIVPINVHALMREIPLVNLYNYAYTFDRMIIELYYGLQNANARKLITELCGADKNLQRITSAKDMLVALLINPYMDVYGNGGDHNKKELPDLPVQHYDKFVKPMLVGAANSGELGRPKFLSDQIFNKAIFGEVYVDYSQYNEVGPSAASPSKISNEQGLQIIARIATDVLTTLNGGHRWQGTVFGANPSTAHIINLCYAVVRYIASHPNENVRVLINLVVNKFTNHGANLGIAEFKALCVAGGTVTQSTQLAMFVSLVVKLIYVPLSMMINEYNAGTLSVAKEEDYARAANLCLSIFENIGNNAAASAYLGTSTNNAAGGPVPGTDAAGLTALLRTFQAAGFDARAAMAFREAGTRAYFTRPVAWNAANGLEDKWTQIIPHIIKLCVTSLPLPIAAAAPNEPELYRDTALRHLITDTILNTSNSAVRLNNDTKPGTLVRQDLHWLDTNTVKADDYHSLGVGIQPDNENVLDAEQIKSKDVSNIAVVLAQVGRLRFDTVFIRNLVFIVNLYRSIRMKLQRDLVYSKDIILKAEPITRPQLTEFFGNQTSASSSRGKYNDSAMWRRYNF